MLKINIFTAEFLKTFSIHGHSNFFQMLVVCFSEAYLNNLQFDFKMVKIGWVLFEIHDCYYLHGPILRALAIHQPLSFLPPPYHVFLRSTSNFSNLNISLTMTASAKILRMAFYRFRYLPLYDTIGEVKACDLDVLIRLKHIPIFSCCNRLRLSYRE